jgi:hypothetical protein
MALKIAAVATSGDQRHVTTGKWPPNSIRFYREKLDVTLQELATELCTNYQTIEKLQNQKMELTTIWADRIGTALGVPASHIAFGDAPDAYHWAAKAVPVIGALNADLRIEPGTPPPQRIGISGRPPGTVAIEIGGDAISVLAGWFIRRRQTRTRHTNGAAATGDEREVHLSPQG